MADKDLVLLWDGHSFSPVSSKSKGIYLELRDEHWFFTYSSGESLIQRRTALRRAREISKVGFDSPTGRKGVGLPLEEEVSPYKDLPEKVTRAEHDYNR